MDNVTDLDFAMPEDTGVLEVLKPGGVEPTGWKITFAGPGHPKTIAWANEQSRKSLRKAQMIEQAQINGKKYKAEDRSPDDVLRENVEWVVARIVDWTPIRIDGEVIEFSHDGATALLLKPKMRLMFSQMTDYLSEEKSFTKRSEAT